MPHLYTSFDDAISPPEGHVYLKPDGTTVTSEITIPGGINVLDRKPQILTYRRRTYIVGQFSRLMMRDEHGLFRAGGVKAPVTVPALADGSDSGGSTGIAIGYQTFVVKAAGKKIAESNPGAATNSLDMAGTGRAWTGLDTAPQDPHVTHTRGYVSVDGEAPALAWERPYPFPSTVNENILTAALGEVLPVRTAPDGTIALDRYARGVPPYTQWVEKYHDAFFYAGDPLHPERIYPSRLYEPEAVNSTPITVYGRTELPWLSTTDGMPVTGIKRQGEDLIVGTLRGIDVVNGYSHGDYTIRRISDYWGVLSHFSMRRCGPLSSLFFAAPQGPTLYNAGAFKFIGGPIETWWRDNFLLYPEVFANCYGAEDRFWRAYKLLLPQYGPGTPYSLYLVCDYNSAEAGEPTWVFDRRARNDQCQGELITDAATSRSYYDLFTGSCDGYVRKDNVESDADDDGDTYQKKMTITTPHRFLGGQEGDDTHGRQYVGLDLFLKHENQDATISMWAGDDDAPSAVAPQWSETSPATAVPSGDRPLVKQTSEHHVPSDLSGKGVTLRVEVTAPVEVEFRGWAVEHIPGEQSRPFRE